MLSKWMLQLLQKYFNSQNGTGGKKDLQGGCWTESFQHRDTECSRPVAGVMIHQSMAHMDCTYAVSTSVQVTQNWILFPFFMLPKWRHVVIKCQSFSLYPFCLKYKFGNLKLDIDTVKSVLNTHPREALKVAASGWWLLSGGEYQYKIKVWEHSVWLLLTGCLLNKGDH